jgi:hypothetical protein
LGLDGLSLDSFHDTDGKSQQSSCSVLPSPVMMIVNESSHAVMDRDRKKKNARGLTGLLKLVQTNNRE